MSEEKSKNYYEILEVPTNATSDEIYKGYVRAKNAYGQDSLALYSLMTKVECDQIIDLIEEAYTIISDPDKRRQYDEARGIQSVATMHKRIDSPEKDLDEASQSRPLSDERRSTEMNMTKIVAKKRFALDFQPKAEMEERIEQATDFTGAFLREIREYKNVDINRMSDMTKVSKTYIRNIEDENIEGLPAAVYVRGFVYQIAKCLKLNPEMVATSYLGNLKSKGAEN